MVSFLMTVRRFLRAVRRALRDPAFQVLAVSTMVILASGTVFYHRVEGWGWLDSLYFCVMTLATVGYGDFSPATAAGKIFAIVYVFLGIGLLVAVFTRLAEAYLHIQQERIETMGAKIRGKKRA